MFCLFESFPGQATKSNHSPSLFLTVSTNTVQTPKPRKSPCKQKALPHKTENVKNKSIFFYFSTEPNELLSNDIQNDIDTTEPGLGEKNVDKSVTVNVC